jgi:hypothetical protein
MEAVGCDLASIDEGQGKAIRKDRTKLFHEIQSKAGSTGSLAMQESDLRIEADCIQSGCCIVGQ